MKTVDVQGKGNVDLKATWSQKVRRSRVFGWRA